MGGGGLKKFQKSVAYDLNGSLLRVKTRVLNESIVKQGLSQILFSLKSYFRSHKSFKEHQTEKFSYFFTKKWKPREEKLFFAKKCF